MLDIQIFDVDHGFCAMINMSDRHTILLDCGYNSQTGFRPTHQLFQCHHRILDGIILPAYSQDHLSGFPDLVAHCLEHGVSVHSLIANPFIHETRFSDFIIPNQRLHNLLSLKVPTHPTNLPISYSMMIQDINLTFFWNNDPTCENVHNLSLVTFLSYRDLHVIFPSDLEIEGWRSLLQSPEFCDCLTRVNIFIAADHGRDEGYCPDVFHYCKPEVVIVSNQAERSVSPHMLRRYESHITSSPFGMIEKPVLTTRDAGVIHISKFLDAARRVSTQPRRSA